MFREVAITNWTFNWFGFVVSTFFILKMHSLCTLVPIRWYILCLDRWYFWSDGANIIILSQSLLTSLSGDGDGYNRLQALAVIKIIKITTFDIFPGLGRPVGVRLTVVENQTLSLSCVATGAIIIIIRVLVVMGVVLGWIVLGWLAKK